MRGIYEIDKNYDHVLVTDREIININKFLTKYNKCIIIGSIIDINEENHEISIVKNSEYKIFGKLCISSKIVYGKTKTGGIKRKFIPHDKRYPEFIVGSNKLSGAYDLLVSIKFDKYDRDIPCGNIINYYGEIGNIEAETEFYKQYAMGMWSKIEKTFNINDYININKDDYFRIDLTNLDIFSIDPYNCQDIDDALHIQQTNDGYEIGIHIADVSSYIKENSPLNKELLKRCESIYLSNQQINMIPDELSIKYISLKKGENKIAFSLIIYVNNEGIIQNYKFVKSIINVKSNYSYDEADKLIIENNILNSLYEMAYKIQKNRKDTTIQISLDNIDSHKMIEVYMVIANHLASIELIKKNKPVILRKHAGYQNKDKSHINIFNMQKALYCLYESKITDIKEMVHKGLGEETYTHFTSPIRRYADIIVHRLLNNEEINITHSDVYFLNKNNWMLNKIERDLELSINLDKLINKDIEVIETNAQIIGLDRNNILLRINDLKLFFNTDIIPYKLLHLVEINEKDDCVIFKSRKNYYELVLKLMSIIKIKISITIKSMNKINCILLEPNTENLYE